MRDKDHSYTGYWSLFGWHINDNETPEEALVREIKEEINYDIKEYSLIKEYILEEFGKIYLFHGYVDSPLEELILREGDEFRFFSYEELWRIKLTPNGKVILADYFESQKSRK